MAYDEDLADRVRTQIGGEPGLAEKAMFGGLAFLLHGHMTVTVSGEGGLLLRVDPAHADELLARPGASRAVMRGRAMTGWLRVAAEVLDEDLDGWVREGITYVRTLPAKEG
ncbi:MAG: TfoX/Sxy family protein [Pseudonocardia sp.]|nr:TfoX/Sxy family protein [Pseudonocardia sp.]